MQRMFTRFQRLAFAVMVLGATVAGCEDDEDDVVLPDGEVVDFDALDLNDDGFIDSTEWASGFGDWDVDDDGAIDSNEWLAGGLGAYDTDGNGVLSTSEYAGAYGGLDADGDGTLDEGELGF